MASTTPSDSTPSHKDNDKPGQSYYVRRNIVPPRELPTLDIEPVDNGCPEIPRFDFLLSFHAVKSTKNPLVITESETTDKPCGLQLHEIDSHDFHDLSFNGEKMETVIPNDQLIHEYANYFEESKQNPFENLISKVYEHNGRSQVEAGPHEIKTSGGNCRNDDVNNAVQELVHMKTKYDGDTFKQAVRLAFPDLAGSSFEVETLSREHEKLKEIHMTLLKSLIEEKKSNSEIITMLKQQNAKLTQDYLSVKSERDMMKQSKENDSEAKTAAASQQPAEGDISDKQDDDDSGYEYEPIGETLEEVELILPKESCEAQHTNIKAHKNYISQTPKSLIDAFDLPQESVVRAEPLVDVRQSDLSEDRSMQQHALTGNERHPFELHFPPVKHIAQNFNKPRQLFYDHNAIQTIEHAPVQYTSPYHVHKTVDYQMPKNAVFENHFSNQGVAYVPPIFQNPINYTIAQPMVHNETTTIISREPVPIIRPVENTQAKTAFSHSVERQNKVTRISLNDYLNSMKTTAPVIQTPVENPYGLPSITGTTHVVRETAPVPIQHPIIHNPYHTLPVQIPVNTVPAQVAQSQVWRQPQLQIESGRNLQGPNTVTWVSQPRHTFGVPSEHTYQPTHAFNPQGNFVNVEMSHKFDDIDQFKRRSAQPRLETPDPQNIYFAYELYSSEHPDQQSGRFINTVSTHQ
jgi:hypothetical protein